MIQPITLFYQSHLIPIQFIQLQIGEGKRSYPSTNKINPLISEVIQSNYFKQSHLPMNQLFLPNSPLVCLLIQETARSLMRGGQDNNIHLQISVNRQEDRNKTNRLQLIFGLNLENKMFQASKFDPGEIVLSVVPLPTL